MDQSEALQAQRDRAIRLQHRLKKLGDRFYDPPEALLEQWNEFFLRFNGYTVAQNSLEYALLLLAGDDRVYGIDDSLEANRIIRGRLPQASKIVSLFPSRVPKWCRTREFWIA